MLFPFIYGINRTAARHFFFSKWKKWERKNSQILTTLMHCSHRNFSNFRFFSLEILEWRNMEYAFRSLCCSKLCYSYTVTSLFSDPIQIYRFKKRSKRRYFQRIHFYSSSSCSPSFSISYFRFFFVSLIECILVRKWNNKTTFFPFTFWHVSFEFFKFEAFNTEHIFFSFIPDVDGTRINRLKIPTLFFSSE